MRSAEPRASIAAIMSYASLLLLFPFLFPLFSFFFQQSKY